MPPKKKKGGKEDRETLERLAREKAEAAAIAELRRLEAEAEELQRVENERRDREEVEEKARLEKEEQLRLMTEKDGRIDALLAERASLTAARAAEVSDLRQCVAEMTRLRNALQNEISVLRLESAQVQQQLQGDKDAARREYDQLKRRMQTQAVEYEDTIEKLRSTVSAAALEVDRQRDAVSRTVEEKEEHSNRMTLHVRSLERQLHTMSQRCNALQVALESHEADDRRNLTLMQLLSTQLSESKIRYEEVVNEERQRNDAAHQAITELEGKCAEWRERVYALEREKAELRSELEADRVESKSLLEQMKFDTQYLREELASLTSERIKREAEHNEVLGIVRAEKEAACRELDAVKTQNDELEALLRRKDREYFDKVTFINAQLANSRTIIAQLQKKLETESNESAEHTKSMTAQLAEVVEREDAVKGELQELRCEKRETEAALRADVAVLKATVFKLQAALVEEGNQRDNMQAKYAEEAKKLRSILDAHFIPHREAAELGGESRDHTADALLHLRTRLKEQSDEMAIRAQVAMDSEARLKAQLENQASIIESLQRDLTLTEKKWHDEVRDLQGCIAGLRRTLDIHFIPYNH